MNKTRFPWEAIPPLVLGIAFGLVYAWILSPVQVVDAPPSALRADFKDQYRAVIAAAYAATGDLPSAEARLSLLGDADAYNALSAQAQRMLAAGEPLASVQQVAALASALREGTSVEVSPTSTNQPVPSAPSAAATLPPPVAFDTSTPFDTETPIPFNTATPRPTLTPTSPPGKPFELADQEIVCDETLPEGLLQVIAMTVSRRQLPGIELILSWAGGEERFFTGFKPELGNGYADALMTPGVVYSLRAADGGTPVSDLTPPTCQTQDGKSYFGSLKITLQRP